MRPKIGVITVYQKGSKRTPVGTQASNFTLVSKGLKNDLKQFLGPTDRIKDGQMNKYKKIAAIPEWMKMRRRLIKGWPMTVIFSFVEKKQLLKLQVIC